MGTTLLVSLGWLVLLVIVVRLTANDLTGIESRADNEEGLGHARLGLLGAD